MNVSKEPSEHQGTASWIHTPAILLADQVGIFRHAVESCIRNNNFLIESDLLVLFHWVDAVFETYVDSTQHCVSPEVWNNHPVNLANKSLCVGHGVFELLAYWGGVYR